MLLDLHCHSKYSPCAISSPRHIAEIARQKGIVVALTDHNTTAGWKDYESNCKRFGIDYILGQEQKVFWENIFAGELLFLFLNEEIKSKQVFEAIDEARAQGALVSVAHPFRKIPNGKFFGIEKILGKIDAVEVFNARCVSNKPNSLASDFAEKHSLGMTAGSDAHFPGEIGKALVETETDSLEEARKLVEKAKIIVHGKLLNPLVHLKANLAKRGLIKKENY